MKVDLNNVDEIIDKHGLERRALIPTLLAIQDKFHYLPSDALHRVAERMSIPTIQVHQVAEFYKAFSLKERGKHIITVCLGTACHVKGGDRMVDHVSRILDIEPGGTTKDMRFTLEAVNCLGTCAIAPVMTVDGKYYGNLAASKVENILNLYREEEAVTND